MGVHPVRKLELKNQKETARVMDNIEELRVFWAAKELEDKARWAAKREIIKQ